MERHRFETCFTVIGRGVFGASSANIEVLAFQDGFIPQQGEGIKRWFETLKSRCNPDIIFTHYRNDAHQDHREVCQMT
jgi:LmbE family N-acetylglucosaminyl deacetylase